MAYRSLKLRSFTTVAFAVLAAGTASACHGGGGGDWLQLFKKAPSRSWSVAGEASLAPRNEDALIAGPGQGVLISSRKGTKQERNLVSEEKFRDVELRLEFMLAHDSNAGVKMHGVYELQLYDSHNTAEPTALDCGGIYPRAVREPRYHHIDEGTPPLTNAAKPPGQWQDVYIRFRAPRFDDSGKKTVSAVFEEARINGLLVQWQAVVSFPTGAYWHLPESETGPVYLQGDHGPVAYRNVFVRALD